MRARRLFHGTTSTAAAAISRDGFVGFNPDDPAEVVATEFDVSVAELRNAAADVFALTTTQVGRGDWVCFAASAAAARSWATRAPETRWELLRAVRLVRGGDPWGDDLPGWRRLQYRNHVPAVVSVELPEELLFGQGGRSAAGLLGLVDRGFDVPELWAAAPLSPDLIVDIEVLDRRVMKSELCSLLGFSDEQFKAAVDRGEVPPSDGSPERVLDEDWWRWESLEAVGIVPAERQP